MLQLKLIRNFLVAFLRNDTMNVQEKLKENLLNCSTTTNHTFCLLPLKSILEEDHNFNKYSRHDIDLLKVPYDFDSIMHYGRKSFSKNGKDTIRSILDPNRPLGQRNGFTDLDAHEINALYDCSGK